MVEFTCIICGSKYHTLKGEPEERMCHKCFEYDDILDTIMEESSSWHEYPYIKEKEFGSNGEFLPYIHGDDDD